MPHYHQSGNTIRRGSFYHPPFPTIITRSLKIPFYGLDRPEEEIMDMLLDLDLDDGLAIRSCHGAENGWIQSAPYSINKRGRWELAQSLADWIMEQDRTMMPYHVTLLEHAHTRTITANGLSVFSTKLPNTRQIAKPHSDIEHVNHSQSSAYFVNNSTWLAQHAGNRSDESVENTKTVKRDRCPQNRPAHWRNHRDHRRENHFTYPAFDYAGWRVAREAERRAERAELRYDLYKPCARESDVTYSVKHQRRVGIGHYILWPSVEERRAFSKKHRPSRKAHHRTEQDIVRSINEYELENHRLEHGQDELDLHWQSDDDDESQNIPKKCFTLAEFISKPTKPQSRGKKRKTKGHQQAMVEPQKTKPCIIENASTSASDKLPDTAELSSHWFEPFPGPIAIPLPASELHDSYLRSKYKGLYIEGKTIPRSFVIDISSKLKKRLQEDEYFEPFCHEFDVEAFVSFVLVKKLEDPGQMLVNVALTGIFEHLPGTYVYTTRGSGSVDDVIARTLDYILKNFDAKNFRQQTAPAPKSNVNPSRTRCRKLDLISSNLNQEPLPASTVFHNLLETSSMVKPQPENPEEHSGKTPKMISDHPTKPETEIDTGVGFIKTRLEWPTSTGDDGNVGNGDVTSSGSMTFTSGYGTSNLDPATSTSGSATFTSGSATFTSGFATSNLDPPTFTSGSATFTSGSATFTLPRASDIFHCGICAFDSSFLCEESETLRIVQVTCLERCGHWFCVTCWRAYLASQILRDNARLQCPEYKCSTAVPPGMVLQTVGGRLYRRYMQYTIPSLLSLHPHLLLCPNPRCDQILDKTNRVACSPATCACGWSFCMECAGDIHWPLSCSQAQAHRHRLKLHDPSLLPDDAPALAVTVYVKPCPYCLRPWEKSGGCNFVYCYCGHHFCWGCGGKTDDPQRNHNRCSMNAGYKAGAVAITLHHITPTAIREVPRKRTRLYTQAARYHQSQGAPYMKVYRTQLSTWLQTTWKYNLPFPVQTSTTDTPVQPEEKFIHWKQSYSSFRRKAIGVLYQVHYMIEHTSVLLETTTYKTPASVTKPGVKLLLSRLLFLASRLDAILKLQPRLGDQSEHTSENLQKVLKYTGEAEETMKKLVFNIKRKLDVD